MNPERPNIRRVPLDQHEAEMIDDDNHPCHWWIMVVLSLLCWAVGVGLWYLALWVMA